MRAERKALRCGWFEHCARAGQRLMEYRDKQRDADRECECGGDVHATMYLSAAAAIAAMAVRGGTEESKPPRDTPTPVRDKIAGPLAGH